MIPQEIIKVINHFFSSKNIAFEYVSGGSINQAFRFSINESSYFLKFNNANQYPDIIQSEVEGLKAITKTGTIQVPKIIFFERVENYEVLVLPFIREEHPTDQLWENFAISLANMHRQPAKYFGWERDNYIGSLPQSNTRCNNFLTFFKEERLQSQIDLANRSGLLSKSDNEAFESLFKMLEQIIPDASPSLVHGDLWSGNFLAGEGQTPYLIDPSIQYSFRETDLAFTHLFGGFGKRFYEAYENSFPLVPDFHERIAIYNLYPLLVHLNLFGSSYLSSIRSTLRKFS
ncbi:fructosamine kinase family protein [Marivirga sp. S37H4]|uniref:Fructosamine kinase family protein n=1 Tax=Marivirga aurantiaca TaxID=2802615 RepID=A0A934WX46_9BACT|nr:fructosamine kinase family protein [Marivirga aurantiaca]MBK6264542.1 fructosamine kinase family protein [Marivirga aurantiaca]